MKKSLLSIAMLLFAVVFANAQRTASVTGDWSDPATWGGLSVPTSSDAVTINSGVTVNVDASASALSITMNGTSDITMGGGSVLTVYNSIVFGGGSNCTLNIGSTLNIKGDLGSGGTFISSGGMVNFNGSGAQNAGGYSFYSVTVNNSSGVTLSGNATVSNTLTLTAGIISTSTFQLSITNPSALAISGANSTKFVSGSLIRTTNSGTAYVFPVGKGGTYYPFSITPTGTTPVIQVEAFAASSGGTAGTNMASISAAEYWSASLSSGSITGAVVGLTRQSALGTLNTIGRSATKLGAYDNLGGSTSGASIITSDNTGSSLGFFVMGISSNTPTGGSVTGTTPVCAAATGVTYTYSGGTPVADTWTWAVPAGATITAGSGTAIITVSWGAAVSGNVSCTPRAGSYTGEPVSQAVVISALAAINLAVGGAGSVYAGSATTITVSASVSGTTYQLRNGSDNVGATVAGTGASINLPTGNLSVTTTFNVLALLGSCPAQLTQTAIVSVIPIPGDAPVSTIPMVSACGGSATVDIPVTVSSFDHVGSVSLTITYDNTKLGTPTASTNAAFSSWSGDNGGLGYNFGTGTVTISGFAPADDTDGVTLAELGAGAVIFTLNFPVTSPSSPLSTTISFDHTGINSQFGGLAPSYLAFDDAPHTDHFLNGGIIQYKISGNVTYYNAGNSAFSDDVSVDLYRDGTRVSGPQTTTVAGYYEFTGLCAGTYQVRASCSASTTGSINTSDAAQVNYWGVYPSSIEKVRFFAGDVAAPLNTIGAADASRIQAYFLQQGSPAFSGRPAWTFWGTGDAISANPGSGDYPTVILTAADVVQNLYGLVTGDFNRSFTAPLGLKSSNSSVILREGQALEIYPDKEFDLPLSAEMDMNVGAVSLILNFPADRIDISEVYLTDDHNTPVLAAVVDNQLRISWYSGEPVLCKAGEPLLTLKIKIRGFLEESETIRFSLANDPLNEIADADFNVIRNAVLSIGSLKVSSTGTQDVTEPVGLVFASYPNPMDRFANFTYSIPADGKVIISIHSMLGATIMVPLNGLQAAGNHSIRIDTDNLPKGIYLATFRFAGTEDTQVRTIKLVRQ